MILQSNPNQKIAKLTLCCIDYFTTKSLLETDCFLGSSLLTLLHNVVKYTLNPETQLLIKIQKRILKQLL